MFISLFIKRIWTKYKKEIIWLTIGLIASAVIIQSVNRVMMDESEIIPDKHLKNLIEQKDDEIKDLKDKLDKSKQLLERFIEEYEKHKSDNNHNFDDVLDDYRGLFT